MDFDLCVPTRLVFFDIGQSLLVDLCLCASTRLVFFDTGQALLMDFELCAPTRLVFFRLVFFTLVNQLEENKTLSYTT